MSILNQNQSYTFSKYFEMGILPEDIAKEFGYTFTRKNLNLPQYQQQLDKIEELKNRIKNTLPYVSLANETARREIFISPIIIDLIYYTKSQVKIEYQIKVNEQLQGYFDYLIENDNNLLIIEAKKADLDSGMTQLFAELIALDYWEENKQPRELIGAVTTGKIWEFAKLNREEKHLEQGLESYRVPEDIEILMRILVQTLIEEKSANMSILNSNQSYTFSKIFELKAETDEFVAEFGFSFQRKKLNLSQYQGNLDRLQELKDRIEEILPYVSLSSELSRREILISRVMTELVHYTHAQLRIEYSLKISEQLQGNLDYLIYSKNNFIVIEAKNEDLVNGFTQLTAELIALDQWEKTQNQEVLLGAVTTGTIWQFGLLNRAKKHIEQDLKVYVVPDDLEPLMRILVQALI